LARVRGRKKMNNLVIKQVAKFVAVGVLNTAIDFIVLNILMFATDIKTGIGYSVFKGISFIVAVINSYVLNRIWTFKSNEKKAGREFAQFFAVSAVGFAINVGVASLVVNVISPHFPVSGISQTIWANIGALAATFCAMVWNFVGYKFFVFKK
jgi:putative flippase GtrA